MRNQNKKEPEWLKYLGVLIQALIAAATWYEALKK